MGWESKPSSVPDGHLSRSQKGPATSSPSWRLSTSGLGEQPASGRFGDCCGEDCPFHPGGCPPVWSLLLSRGTPRANLDCRRPVTRPPPRLSPGTHALCSSDFPLAPERQRPSLPTHPQVINVQDPSRNRPHPPWSAHGVNSVSRDPRCRRGDLNSHEVTLTTP